MIFRYLGFLLVTLFCSIIGFLITPLNYYIKRYVRKYNITPLWWFLNDSVPLSNTDIDSGDFGRFEHNFKGFFQQNAMRNSHWNLRLLLKPKYGKHYDIKGDLRELSTERNPQLDFRFGTFKYNNKKYFRLSWIVKVYYWYHHGKFGMSNHSLNLDGTVKKTGRYYFKLKAGKLSKLNFR
jgi:hypothetical protein